MVKAQIPLNGYGRDALILFEFVWRQSEFAFFGALTSVGALLYFMEEFYMKRMITIALLLLPVSILLLLTGCSKKSVSEVQLKNDLLEHEEVQACFFSEFTKESTYSIDALEIIKEQINSKSKQDLIYCNFKIKNDYFNVELSAQCTYNFYDKGGWILDELNILEKSTIPISCADGQEVVDKILKESSDKYYKDRTAINCLYNNTYKTLRHGTLSVVDSAFDKEKMQTKIFVCYKSDVIEVNGHYLLHFDNNAGWVIESKHNSDEDKKIVMYVSDFTADYSSAIGNFASIPFEKRNIIGYDLDVTEILNNSISYSIKIDDYEASMNTFLDSTTLLDDFDPLTGGVSLKIKAKKRYLYGDELDPYVAHVGTFIYNPIDDRWDSSYGPNYPSLDSYSPSQYFVPHQLGRK